MNRLKRRTWDSLDFDWKTGDIHNFDTPSDVEPDYDSPSIPNNPHSYENKNNNFKNKIMKEIISTPSNRTIINLTEDGATIQCSYDNDASRKTTFAKQTNRDNDKKTIVVEVHHTNNTTCGKTHSNYPPPIKKEFNPDTSSISSSATLSSAIAEEIQRRKLNKKTSNSESNIPKVVKKPVPKPVDNEKKKQHDALMDEFKKVHRKMFACQETKPEQVTEQGDEMDSLDRQQTLPLRKADTEYIKADLVKNGHHQPQREATDSPPPPPPMPITNGQTNGVHMKSNEEKPILKKSNSDLITNGNYLKNGNVMRTPTPDYNNTKPDIAASKIINNNTNEKADLESLESFMLKNPSNVEPKPPSNYFMRAPNGTATMKKLGRPVSVTIGEYASGGGSRREPSKLDFLNGDKPDGASPVEDVPITNRLQSELALTLSRSNLRKKTEALADAGR